MDPARYREWASVLFAVGGCTHPADTVPAPVRGRDTLACDVQVDYDGRPLAVYSIHISDRPDGSSRIMCAEVDKQAASVFDGNLGTVPHIAFRLNGQRLDHIGFHLVPLSEGPGWSSRVHLTASLSDECSLQDLVACPIAARGGLSDAEFEKATGNQR